MDPKIEIKKQELNKLLKQDISLNSEKVIELSQNLDMLLNLYYKENLYAKKSSDK